MRRLRRVSRADFWVATAAILGTLVFGILAGVVIGIALSLLWLVYVATHPQMSTLGRERGTQVFRDLDEHPDDETLPGTVVMRMDGGIFFATADALEDRVRTAMLAPDVSGVVLHFAGVNFVDSQGAATVSEIIRMAEESGVELRLAAVRPAVRRDARAGGRGGAARSRPHPRQRPPGRGRAGRPVAPGQAQGRTDASAGLFRGR